MAVYSTWLHMQCSVFDISNDAGRVKRFEILFHDFLHTYHVSADALVPFERITIFARCVVSNPMARGPFLFIIAVALPTRHLSGHGRS